MSQHRKILKTRTPVRVPVVNLLDPNVEPSDAALCALMAAVEQSVTEKNADVILDLRTKIRTETLTAIRHMSQTILVKR